MKKPSPQPAPGTAQSSRSAVFNRAYQFRALRPVLLYTGLLFFSVLLLVLLPMHRSIAADPNPVVQVLLRSQLVRLEFWLMPLLLVSGSLAGIAALMQARRVARSIDCVKEGLARLAAGAPEPVVFRDGDEFRALEPVFAAAIGRVEELTRGKAELLRFLRRNVEGLSQRAITRQISSAELGESLDIILRDIDAEMKKVQLRS